MSFVLSWRFHQCAQRLLAATGPPKLCMPARKQPAQRGLQAPDNPTLSWTQGHNALLALADATAAALAPAMHSPFMAPPLVPVFEEHRWSLAGSALVSPASESVPRSLQGLGQRLGQDSRQGSGQGYLVVQQRVPHPPLPLPQQRSAPEPLPPPPPPPALARHASLPAAAPLSLPVGHPTPSAGHTASLIAEQEPACQLPVIVADFVSCSRPPLLVPLSCQARHGGCRERVVCWSRTIGSSAASWAIATSTGLPPLRGPHPNPPRECEGTPQKACDPG